ncbi:MAG: hypothetical protein VYC82_05420 [Verrucomicrobiota bacterium]|nr:hypothetical protein [Verrucomicrobiota bacterium]
MQSNDFTGRYEANGKAVDGGGNGCRCSVGHGFDENSDVGHAASIKTDAMTNSMRNP